ncbi:chorismate mutase [Actinoallomurus iriomotensis]|uniref:chorismate mutase n=1 Tax=Actinoallomurus iriomotensis TaxID=478107 RepID=A0A9W6W3I3_9ACTN|nr:chorismate mutase [Actinoallomurus iriomotensis]GLY87996.1 chorismate mutase [Actinoallomurus iriomotensis]
MARGLAVTALMVGVTRVTVPQADAAGAPTHAVPSNDALQSDRSLGRLGPLTDLVIHRLRVSDDVAASKFGTGSPIDDPAREQQVLEQVRNQAGDLGLDPGSATAFFQDQITASKVVQKGLFARWTAHPEEAPTTRPDLGQIRTRLDQLTADLLRELKATVRLRDEPTACTVQLAVAAGSGAALERLDALHRQALAGAVHSVCVASVK